MTTKLSGRSTCLSFDDFESEQLPIRRGIDLGCPLSVIFYLLYNRDLVLFPKPKSNELCIAYIDDITYVTWGKTFEETHEALESMMSRTGGALEWSSSHHSAFELDKTGCIDFSLNKATPRPDLTIGSQQVTPTRTHTLLGVCLDQELRWKDQGNRALAKGMAWVTQLSRLARFSYGTSASVVRRLYRSIAVPRFTYAADIWYAPVTLSITKGVRGSGSIGIAKRLARVQNTAARAILGAMRSTPVDALNSFASLPPVHILLNEICQKAALRLASAPPSHPLHKAVLKCAKGRKRHAPPLQLILRHLNFNPCEIGKWTPKGEVKALTPILVTAFPTRNQACVAERLDNSHIQVYVDGSSSCDGVSSAAVLYEGGRQKMTLGHRLGDQGGRSVLEAELAAILLALQLILLVPLVDDATIFLDSQLALRSLDGQPVGAPRALVVAIRRALNKARNHVGGTEITLRWCPGHAGSRGNEMADTEARAAARGRQYPADIIPIFLKKYRPLADPALVKQTLLADNLLLADSFWTSSCACVKLSSKHRDLKASSFLELSACLNRSRATLLFRLMTGHVALRDHLACIQCEDDNTCGSCHSAPETVAHFLLRCPSFVADRHEHLGSKDRDFLSLNFLFSNKAAIPFLFNYIKATGRFSDSLR